MAFHCSFQMALVQDENFKVWVEKYAADQQLFFKDFALAFGKLIGASGLHLTKMIVLIFAELGVDRDDTGFARLVKKAAEEQKPLDKVSMPGGGGCPFAGTTGRGRDAKL